MLIGTQRHNANTRRTTTIDLHFGGTQPKYATTNNVYTRYVCMYKRYYIVKCVEGVTSVPRRTRYVVSVEKTENPKPPPPPRSEIA